MEIQERLFLLLVEISDRKKKEAFIGKSETTNKQAFIQRYQLIPLFLEPFAPQDSCHTGLLAGPQNHWSCFCRRIFALAPPPGPSKVTPTLAQMPLLRKLCWSHVKVSASSPTRSTFRLLSFISSGSRIDALSVIMFITEWMYSVWIRKLQFGNKAWEGTGASCDRL